MPRDRSRPVERARSSWALLVTASACVLLGVGLAGLLWWGLSSERRTATFDVRGSLNEIALDLGGSDAEIVGGREEAVVSVRRTDSFAFDQPVRVERDVSGGRLRIRSRCPPSVMSACSASYRLTVPNNVPVSVRTEAGNVRLTGVRASARIDTRTGDIAASSYCGFLLRARAESGDVSATAACPPERLELRSRTGRVRAVVPPGRYRIDADSDEGARRVRGLTAADDAPFQIQALSRTGDVELEAAP